MPVFAVYGCNNSTNENGKEYLVIVKSHSDKGFVLFISKRW
jgi:hypothetical protein